MGGNTHLAGGVIASTADPSKNYLSTGSLTWEAIQNEASYKSSSIGAGGGFSSGKSGDDGARNPYGSQGVSGAPGLGLSQKGSSSGTTDSSIANGTIVVRDGPVDLSGLKRDGTLEGQALKPIFDEKKLAEQQEMAQVAGQVGFRAAGDIGEKFGLKDGSPEKIALHGAVAAAVASLGGGNVGAAVSGAAANQLAINTMAKSLQDAGYQPGTPEFASLLKMGSAALGLAVGGETGSSVAEAATQYNWLLHSEVVDADKRRAACADQQCRDNITAEMEKLSLDRDHEREVFSNNAFATLAKQNGVLTYGDRDNVANAYYAQYGLKPGDAIDPDYAPAYELGYQFRQVISGWSGAREAVKDTLDHYQANPGEIPGAIVGSAIDKGKNIVTGTVTYLTSDVPAWTLSNQVYDAYGAPTAANSGVFLYNGMLSTGLATAGWLSGGFEPVAGSPGMGTAWAALPAPGSSAYVSQLTHLMSGGGLAATAGSNNLALGLALGAAGDGALAVGGISGLTDMTAVSPSPSGNLSAGKFNTSGVSLIDLSTDEKIIAQYVQANGDRTGVNTENLVSIIAERQGLTVLDGGKYGSNNGFDHVLQGADGSVTILIDSKQITGGSASLSTDKDGLMQLSDAWVSKVLRSLDENSAVWKAVTAARDNGSLVRGVAGVDRTTGRPVLLRVQ